MHDENELLGDRTGSAHYSGTTRMSDNSNFGVVDKNCKHHDINNLFISSSSVFPTESFVNPTYNIVALSLRIGEFIDNL